MTEPPTGLSMLKDAYAQVLDATKHQDDKIGRVLTAVAFLIAGSIGLANIAGARAIGRHFAVGAHHLPPLALVAVISFAAFAVLGAVILLYGLSTPLRLPGVTNAASPNPNGPDSQIYFLSIARTSLDDWKQRWAPAAEQTRRSELSAMYAAETYNLAVRTNARYNRTSEAAALIALALLGLACAVPLVLIATTAPCSTSTLGSVCTDAVPMTRSVRWTLAVILGGFCFITQITRLRSAQLNTEDLKPTVGKHSEGPITATRFAALLTGLASGASVFALNDSGRGHAAGGVAIGAFALVLVLQIYTQWKPAGGRKPATNLELGATVSFTGVGIGLCIASECSASALLGLLAAVSPALGIAMIMLLGPTAATVKRQRDYSD